MNGNNSSRTILAGFIIPAVLSSILPLAGGENMSMQQPIARIKMVKGETFQVDMMPAKSQPRLIKKGDTAYAIYKAAFSDMKVGDITHVTELPDDPKLVFEQDRAYSEKGKYTFNIGVSGQKGGRFVLTATNALTDVTYRASVKDIQNNSVTQTVDHVVFYFAKDAPAVEYVSVRKAASAGLSTSKPTVALHDGPMGGNGDSLNIPISEHVEELIRLKKPTSLYAMFSDKDGKTIMTAAFTVKVQGKLEFTWER
jgi:hypothetical protein